MSSLFPRLVFKNALSDRLRYGRASATNANHAVPVLRLCAAAILAGALCHGRALRVCADPNNLPFSNQSGEGFENKIAERVARDLGATLEYTWWSERKSFVRNSLDAGKCDVLAGVATGVPGVLATRPYLQSTYVLLSRTDRRFDITSLLDDRLAKLRIGVHVVGDDFAPPARVLAARGLSANLVGFSLFGTYGEPNPPAKLVSAVDRGDIDIAIVWGPFAGFFAQRSTHPLHITPVAPAMWMGIPFTYGIAMGVRPGDDNLRAELDHALARECRNIADLLSRYGVPKLSENGGPCEGSLSQSPASSH